MPLIYFIPLSGFSQKTPKIKKLQEEFCFLQRKGKNGFNYRTSESLWS